MICCPCRDDMHGLCDGRCDCQHRPRILLVPDTGERCCVCDSARVDYHNFRGQPFCWPNKVLMNARLQMESHLALAAECAGNGFAVPVTDDSEPFGHTHGYMITAELARELVAEGRLKWIT